MPLMDTLLQTEVAALHRFSYEVNWFTGCISDNFPVGPFMSLGMRSVMSVAFINLSVGRCHVGSG